MRLEQLKYLLSLKETGSISRTAEKMLISHQAVSKAIKALETELSITILERSPQGVSFTPAGLEVCSFAEYVFAGENNLMENLAVYRTNTASQISCSLTIYAVPRYITPDFLAFIEKLHFAYPHLNLSVQNTTYSTILQNTIFDNNTIVLCTDGYHDLKDSLLNNELGAYISEQQLRYRLLDSQELLACVHQKSPLSKHSVISIEQSQTYPYVSFTYLVSSSQYAASSVSYSAKYVIDGFEQQKNLIKQGTCFGRYTRKEFDSFFSKNYRLIPLEGKPYLSFIALYKKQSDNPCIELFLQQLTEYMRF